LKQRKVKTKTKNSAKVGHREGDTQLSSDERTKTTASMGDYLRAIGKKKVWAKKPWGGKKHRNIPDQRKDSPISIESNHRKQHTR